MVGRSDNRHSGRGSAMVELAIVAPLLLVMILGVVDVVSVLTTYITLTNAAREGARLAGRGNIFEPEQVLQVVAQQSRNVDVAGRGAVLLTTFRSRAGANGACCTTSYTVQTLCGSASSHFTEANLRSLWQSLTPSLGGDPDPSYLRKEEIIVIEVFYHYESITGFLHGGLPMWAYCIMPVAAPS